MAKKPETSVCQFSEDGRFRYLLDHTIDETVPSYARKSIVWLLCNPSVANQTQLDPTLRKCRGFTERLGAHHMTIVNAFAFVGTDPNTMLAAEDPVGPLNDEAIQRATAREGVLYVIAGWGVHGSHRGRDKHLMDMLMGKLHALRVNKDGTPGHPLYIPYTAQPQMYGYSYSALP